MQKETKGMVAFHPNHGTTTMRGRTQAAVADHELPKSGLGGTKGPGTLHLRFDPSRTSGNPVVISSGNPVVINATTSQWMIVRSRGGSRNCLGACAVIDAMHLWHPRRQNTHFTQQHR